MRTGERQTLSSIRDAIVKVNFITSNMSFKNIRNAKIGGECIKLIPPITANR